MNLFSIISLSALAIIAMLLVWREGLLTKPGYFVAAAIIIAAAFCVRALCLSFMSNDYKLFLMKWVQRLRDGGGFAALRQSIGNYNLPYLYLLAAASYINIEPLYPIKIISIAFDVLLAWSAMKTVGIFSKSKGRRLFAFLGALLLPTVVLNGAYWGQCDGIYCAFALLSIYLALKGRPVCSVIAITLSLAFKLQAIFIIPVFFVFLMTGKVKLRHLIAFPITYIVTTLPAVISGRPVFDAITLYFNQAETVGDALNYNSPSVFSLISGGGYESMLASLGIAFAFIFLFGLLIFVFYHRKHISNLSILSIALLMAIGIPFLLPHMHDRYFFCADVISFVFAVVIPRYLPVPVFCSFASLICYDAYLTGSYRPLSHGKYLLPSSGAFALIAAMIMIFICLASRLTRKTGKE